MPSLYVSLTSIFMQFIWVVHEYTHVLLLGPPLTVASTVDLALAAKVPNFCHLFSVFSIVRVLNFCLVVEILAALRWRCYLEATTMVETRPLIWPRL